MKSATRAQYTSGYTSGRPLGVDLCAYVLCAGHRGLGLLEAKINSKMEEVGDCNIECDAKEVTCFRHCGLRKQTASGLNAVAD